MAKKNNPKILSKTKHKVKKKATGKSVFKDIALRPIIKSKYFLFGCLGILALSFSIYYATYNFGYVLDDKIVITGNEFTKKGFGGIGQLMTTESMTGYFGEQKNILAGNRYRPLSLVTFAAEYGINSGLNPGFSHIINILLYALTGMILFLLLEVLLKNRPESKNSKLWSYLPLAASLIFIAHPLHVEAVANIKGRDELMALLFSLAALLAFVKSREKSVKAIVIGSICYFLGLLSKENTITFLAVIPATIYFFDKGKFTKVLTALAITTVIYLIWRFSVSGVPDFGKESNDLMNNPYLGMNGADKFATIMYTLGLYIKLLFYPHPLTHDYYPYAIGKMNFGDWQVWLSLLAYGAMGVYAILNIKKKRILSYGILFYLFTLSIMSNIVISLGTFMNDRFVFMSSVGFCLILAWLIWWLAEKIKSPSKLMIGLLLMAIPVVAFSIRSFVRVPAWKDAVSLNFAAMPASQNSARANSFIATALFEEYKLETDRAKQKALLDQAKPYVDKSLAIFPNYMNAHTMKAGIAAEYYRMDGNLSNLLNEFYEVARIRPELAYIDQYCEYLNQRETGNRILVDFYVNVGKALIATNTKRSASYAVKYLTYGQQNDTNNAEIQNLLNQARQMAQ